MVIRTIILTIFWIELTPSCRRPGLRSAAPGWTARPRPGRPWRKRKYSMGHDSPNFAVVLLSMGTEGDWLVCVVNRSPRNLNTTCDCMVHWLAKKSVLEKIVRGNEKIGIIRVVCTMFCSVICWIGYPYHVLKVSLMDIYSRWVNFVATELQLKHCSRLPREKGDRKWLFTWIWWIAPLFDWLRWWWWI
jgi:hypothetical protein